MSCISTGEKNRAVEGMKLPHMRKPCKDCPFRKDSKRGWLGRERMQEILGSESFVCHKDNSKQCAGHMLIKGPWNIFVVMAQRLGIDLPLRGRKLVFDTEKDCLDHHDDSFKREEIGDD